MLRHQLRCMNEDCGIIFSKKGKCLDGLSCTECRGPLFIEPYNPNVEHVPYDIKKLRLAPKFASYVCLCCGHKDKISFPNKEDSLFNEEYTEVKVCPKCNGAWVDKYRVGKYVNNTKRNMVDLPYLSGKNSMAISLPANAKIITKSLNQHKQKDGSGMYLKRIVEKRLEDLRSYEEYLLKDIDKAKQKLGELQRVREEIREEREELERYL